MQKKIDSSSVDVMHMCKKETDKMSEEINFIQEMQIYWTN